MSGFRERLAARQSMVKSLVCVGLDPLPEKFPDCLRSVGYEPDGEGFRMWMTKIALATGKYASMFKPQSAHWEAVSGGAEALKKMTEQIHAEFPGIVFLDCKRGDIARTQKQYGVACFNNLGVDGMNFSPYMGRDCMAALVDKANLGRALVGLCYTSNPDAREVQDVRLADGRCFWEFIAERTLAWAEALGIVENSGLVMAAAYENPKGSGNVYSEHLTRCRQIVGDKLWFLIPGIGTQGGFIAETVRKAYVGLGSIAINSSSEIDFASSGEDYAEAAAEKAKELRDQINAAL
jgi:orotidine-5'-phosphate decarboxylase